MLKLPLLADGRTACHQVLYPKCMVKKKKMFNNNHTCQLFGLSYGGGGGGGDNLLVLIN